MDHLLYILDSGFNKVKLIENYSSVVWTERYSRSGDFEITYAKSDLIPEIDEGVFIGSAVSQNVGIVDTTEYTPEGVKFSGSFLPKFLENRVIRNGGTNPDGSSNVFTTNSTVEYAMLSVMFYFCDADGLAINVPVLKDKAREAFTNFSVIDQFLTTPISPAIQNAIPIGNVYDAMVYLAEPAGIGWRFYPELVPEMITPPDPVELLGYSDTYDDVYSDATTSPSTYLDVYSDLYSDPEIPSEPQATGNTTYILKYEHYKGLDRSKDQNTNPVVMFEPALDSLIATKELHTISSFKTIAHTFAPKIDPSDYGYDPADIVGYAEVPGMGTLTDFDRRTIAVNYDDLTVEDYAFEMVKLWDTLNKRAKDVLANNNYVRLLDGEIVPNMQYKFGVDYNMGDIISLKGLRGTYQKARVTEYIYSHDSSGHKEYPTLSVIE